MHWNKITFINCFLNKLLFIYFVNKNGQKQATVTYRKIKNKSMVRKHI